MCEKVENEIETSALAENSLDLHQQDFNEVVRGKRSKMTASDWCSIFRLELHRQILIHPQEGASEKRSEDDLMSFGHNLPDKT